VEIKDNMRVSRNDVILSPMNSDGIWVTGTSVLPDKSETQLVSSIRIVVIGNLIKDGIVTDKSVGAYIDIDWPPSR
jgi:hypothetical protein